MTCCKIQLGITWKAGAAAAAGHDSISFDILLTNKLGLDSLKLATLDWTGILTFSIYLSGRSLSTINIYSNKHFVCVYI